MDLGKAEALARKLMDEHGLADWTMEWSKSRTHVGYCIRPRKVIALSRPYVALNNEWHIRDTILHEIAHALTKNEGHTPRWRKKALSLGAHLSKDGLVNPPELWIATCPHCGFTEKYNRRMQASCPECVDQYDPRYLLAYTPNPAAAIDP